MFYGLYLSAQGAQIQTLRQGLVANNLANSTSTSFKRDFLRVQQHPTFDAEHGRVPTWMPGNLNEMTGGTSPAETVTDYTQSPLTRTSNQLDIALEGAGFLKVQDGKQTYLTRDGKLALNQQNQLVTRDHGYVLLSSTGGPLPNLDPSLPIHIMTDGSLSQGGDILAQVALVEPDSYRDLRKTGENHYIAEGKTAPAKSNAQFKQGYLENSGVNPIHGMMELIESSRVLEANVNMIKHQDEAVARLLQSLPKK
jgi:flagellar basal body rod protein FlgG